MSDFVHLHLHTEYSTLDGINRVDSLPEYIKNDLGQQAVAMTDHGTVGGTYRFWKSCMKARVKPILGMEAYYAVGDRTVRGKDHLGRNYHHMVLLSLNNIGLKNLTELSSDAYTSGMYFKPRIDDSLLAEKAEGLAATSACLGSYSSQLILAGETQAAEALLDHHAAMFKDRFFIEVQLHEDTEQQVVNKTLIEIANKRNWPLILTNDCHYTHETDKRLHESTLCMNSGAVMSDPPWNPEVKENGGGGKTRFSFGDIDVHVAHHDWMWERAQKQGIPYEAISNTVHLAKMVDHEDYFKDRKNRYPHFQGDNQGLPHWELLEKVAKEGLYNKMGGMPPKNYRERLDSELHTIKKMGFYDYLLIVQQFIQGAKSKGISVGPGRGSAAGSLVAYALGITQVDPIKYDLLFSRFLNYGRSANPLHFDIEMRKQIADIENVHTRDSNYVHTNTVHSHVCSHKQHLPSRLMECFNHGKSIKAH